MTARPIILILPCHSLDDFPTHHEGDEAAGLLASWTAPWHPMWIAATGEAPRWINYDAIDVEPLRGTIVLTPKAVEPFLPDDFQNTVREAGADHLGNFNDRSSLVSALHDLQRSSREDANADAVDEELVADFHALAYWFLQIEILSRQISYHSNLDEHRFRENVTEAAKQAVAGEKEAARNSLRKSFGLLIEERDHYYPVDAYLLDLALVADTTKPSAIERELQRSSPVNLWMTGENLQSLQTAAPQVTKALTTAIDDRKVGLVGGEFGELPLPFMSPESLRREWLRGIDTFQTILNKRPATYFRRRFGLTPRLASVLGSFGWSGVIHATLDAGRFPINGQACSQWKDKDSAGIAAISRIPLDANLPETFLRLSTTMGRSMETDYVATLCLARWAGSESEWFDDVRRGAAFGLRLGDSTTCDDYFQSNHPDIHGEMHSLDQYRSAYLQQAVDAHTADPISRWVHHRRSVACLEAADRLLAIAAMTGGAKAESSPEVVAEIERGLQIAMSVVTGNAHQGVAESTELVELSLRCLLQASQRLAATVTGNDERPETESDISGWLLTNSYSHPHRTIWELESETFSIENIAADDKEKSPLHAFHHGETGCEAAVDISGNGFAWLPSTTTATEKAATAGAESLIERLEDGMVVLRNEFCSVKISPQTGGIAGLYDFHSRGNRLSQRIVRERTTGVPLNTVMQCDQLTVPHDTPVLGSITTAGQLLDDEGESVAKFEQTVSLSRGLRMANIRIHIEAMDSPTGSPWKDYLACRWAWPHDTDELTRCVQGVMYPTEGRRCESPWLFEVNDGQRRTALLTGGLPFHHRHDRRMLDTLLVVAGESERDFELAIGVDLPQPLGQSESHWLPTLAVPCSAPPAQNSGWLFHVSSKHVRVTGYTPIWNDSGCCGIRVRLQEQSGGAGSFKLRGPRAFTVAKKLDFTHNAREDLSITDGVAMVSINANEWIEVACQW